MATSKPMPLATTISAPFWQALEQNELHIQQCNQCDGWVFFPRKHCTHCLAHDLEFKSVNGEGTLYSYTLTRIPTMPEFSDEMPQALAVVELSQGVRINTTLIDVAESDIEIGMAVKPVFDKVSSDGKTLLRFTSAANQGGVRDYQDPLLNLERNAAGQVQVPVDNLSALYALADNTFTPWSNEYVVDQALINDFADLSGDDYWLHTDPARAKIESPFKTTIAHGFLTASLMPKAFEEVVAPSDKIASMINYGIDKLRFLEPVKSGDAVKYFFELKEVTEKPQGKLYKVEGSCKLKSSGNPALVGSFVMLAIIAP
mgnify:CR=1 FL=1